MHPGVIVLKCGGSVLRDREDLPSVVHEVYRWHRQGWKVIVVVSAFAGHTDLLHRTVATGVGSRSRHALAAALCEGEREAASALSRELAEAGLEAATLDPVDFALKGQGDPLDASPLGFDESTVRRSLEVQSILVVPGYFATDADGRIVTLGRGGSDLTAIVLAQGLGPARCRLIKDVDGLFEHDPAASGPAPRRFTRISYADALRLDGTIVQHKAIRFAREHGVVFEVGAANSSTPTVVGANPSLLEPAPGVERPLRVALLGLGSVGAGVAERLSRLDRAFEVVSTVARDPGKHRPLCRRLALPEPTQDPVEAACSGVDVVVELMGGVEVAHDAIVAALRSGADVVTANKAVLARHGEALQALAQATSTRVLASASVGGATPIIETARRLRARSTRGVLNGTANYVLGQVALGTPVDRAIAQAQCLGLAEGDPARDLDGRDSLDKLCVLAQACNIEPREVDVSLADVRRARLGELWRQIATLSPEGALRVECQPASHTDVFGDLPGAWNAAELLAADGSCIVIRGCGAGRWPTTEAVLADMLEMRRGVRSRRLSVATS